MASMRWVNGKTVNPTYSTFHRWVRQGVYPLEWGGAEGDLYDELE